MPKSSKSEELAQFANSWRGRWIISEALSVAIDTLSKLPIERRPTSDINDMTYLRDNMFGLYEAMKKAGLEDNDE